MPIQLQMQKNIHEAESSMVEILSKLEIDKTEFPMNPTTQADNICTPHMNKK